MDARNQGLGIITKQWPKRPNKFEMFFGFSGNKNQSKESTATIPKQPATQPQKKKRRVDFFEDQRKKVLDAIKYEEIADKNMDIAEGRITSGMYGTRPLSTQEKCSHFENAYKNYSLAINIAKREGRDASLDVYFSCLNALELRSRIDPENKNALSESIMSFIEQHELKEKIAKAARGKTKKREYTELVEAYIKEYIDYKSTYETHRFTS